MYLHTTAWRKKNDQVLLMTTFQLYLFAITSDGTLLTLCIYCKFAFHSMHQLIKFEFITIIYIILNKKSQCCCCYDIIWKVGFILVRIGGTDQEIFVICIGR